LEKRRNKRYYLSAPMKFSWKDLKGGVGKGEGSTRDISISSVFVSTPSFLPAGSEVSMDVLLPPRDGTGNGVRLRTQGIVIRSESEGFAAIAEMNFRIIHLQNAPGRHEVRRKKDSSDAEVMKQLLQLQN